MTKAPIDFLIHLIIKRMKRFIATNAVAETNMADPDKSNPSQDKLYKLQQKFETQSKTLMKLNDTLQNISQEITPNRAKPTTKKQ